MTTFNLTCAAVEATLADYLDETLEGWVRESIDEHLNECASCSSVARDLRNMSREAAALPALLPEEDVWPRVAGRIGAPLNVLRPQIESEPPVLVSETAVPASEPLRLLDTESAPTPERGPPLPHRRRTNFDPRWMGLAAAALVLVTAGTTFLLTVQWVGPAQTRDVASNTRAAKTSSSEKPSAEPRSRESSPARVQAPLDSSTLIPPPGQLGSPVLVSATSAPEIIPSPEEVVYQKEITTLQRIVRRQKSELDPSTVTVIDKNVRTVDSAIAQIREALKEDPGSSLLGGQASRALEMKVELLRRAAMLRSSTL